MLHSLKTTITHTPSLYRKYPVPMVVLVFLVYCWHFYYLLFWMIVVLMNSVTVLLCLTGHQQLVMRCGFYSLLKAELPPILGFNCSIYSGCYGLLSHQHLTPYLFYFKITSQFLPVCSAQYMGSKLTKFKFRVCSWTNFDICLISFYFISIYCYDCLNTNLLIHFFFYSGSMSLCVDTRSATEKVMGERWDLTKHVYPL